METIAFSPRATPRPSLSGRVWVVDDNAEIRLSLDCLFNSAGARVRSFASARTLFAALQRGRPNCLVLDYQLPDSDGLAIQADLAERNHKIPIVFLSGAADIAVAVTAMRRGAVDFIEKPGRDERLITAVNAALCTHRAQQARQRACARFKHAIATLSGREHDVLELIVQGLRNKHIAQQLGISPRTVETYRENAKRKLEVRNTTELVRAYLMVCPSQTVRGGVFNCA